MSRAGEEIQHSSDLLFSKKHNRGFSFQRVGALILLLESNPFLDYLQGVKF